MSGGNESQNHFFDGSVANQLTLKRGVPDAPGATVMSVVDGNVAFPNTPGFSFRNKIINGGMRIQQRANVTLSGTPQYSVDRWRVSISNGTVSAGYATSSDFGQSPSGKGLRLVGLSCVTCNIVMQQRIESANSLGLSGKKVTVSGIILQDTGAPVNYRVSLRKANAVDDFTTTTSITDSTDFAIPSGVATAFAQTLIIPAGDAANGLELWVWVPTALTVTNKNFTLSAVQLEEGSIATPFEQRPIGLELSLCQRYYWRGLPCGAFSFSAYAAGAFMGFVIHFPTKLRVIPAVIDLIAPGAIITNVTSAVRDSITSEGFRYLVTSTAAGGAAVALTPATDNFSASAEL